MYVCGKLDINHFETKNNKALFGMTSSATHPATLSGLYSNRLSLHKIPADKTDRKQLFRALARNVTPKAEGTKAAREISVASSQDQDHVSASHRLAPLDFLADYLGEKLKAVTMICQDPVTDKDFLAEYEAFYSKTFMNYDKKCKRLHFFSIFPNENESALDFLDRASSLAKTSNIYLGFVTLRPIRTCPIGPTIIAPGEDCRYLKVCDKFLVTISGAEFSIEGTPFLQQDSSVGACVQASLWMALRAVRKKDQRPPYRISDITQAATSGSQFGRIYPNRDGINGQQLLAALNRFGYHSFGFKMVDWQVANKVEQATFASALANVEPANDQDRIDAIKAQLYPYVESGIPVVLECNDQGAGQQVKHAVLLVGHGWPVDCDKRTFTHYQRFWPKKHQISLNTRSKDGNTKHGSLMFEWPTSVFAETLYINDDRRGPYLPIQDHQTRQGDIDFKSISTAFPVLPKDVYMDAGEALEVFKRIIKNVFDDLLSRDVGISEKDVSKFFLVRQKLISRHKFRTWASTLKNRELRQYYREKHLPDMLWCFGLNSIDDYYKTPVGGESQIGEVLLDPTGDLDDYPLLTFHLNIGYIVNKKLGTPGASISAAKEVVIDFDADTRHMAVFQYDAGEASRSI